MTKDKRREYMLHFRIQEQLREDIRIEAALQGMTVSEFCRRLIEEKISPKA